MRSRVLLAALMLGVVPLASASCGSDDPEELCRVGGGAACGESAPCPAGTQCFFDRNQDNARCAEACETTADCATGETCDGEFSLCVRSVECSAAGGGFVDGSSASVSEACEAFCGVDEMCSDAPIPNCVGDCVTGTEAGRADATEACFDSLLDLYSCLGALSCTEIDAYLVGDPAGSADYPCKAEDEVYFAECLVGEISDTDITQPCTDFCAVDGECSAEPLADCETLCVDDAETRRTSVPAMCFDALAEFYSCIGTLSCEELDGYLAGDPFGAADYPCKTEELAWVEC